MAVRHVVVPSECRNPTMGEIVTWLPSRQAEQRVAYAPGPQQFGDLWLPRAEPGLDGHPVVISVHGGGWQSDWSHAYQDRFAEAMSDLGVAVWNVEYRRVGNTGGGFPGTFDDIATAVDYVRVLAGEHPLDLSRVVAVGHSSGAHLVAWLAARGTLPAGSPGVVADPLPLRGVVELAPLPDLEHLEFYLELWAGLRDVVLALTGTASDEEFLARLPQVSPSHMGPADVPRTLVIGDRDEIPVRYVTEHAHAAAQAGAEVSTIVIESANHFDLVDPGGGAWECISATVLAMLARDPVGEVA